MNWLLLISFPLISISCLIGGRRLIHYFQLESYQFPGYFRTVLRNRNKAFLPGIVIGVIWTVLFITIRCFPSVSASLPYAACAVALLAASFLLSERAKKDQSKKPLVFTARVKRLYLISFLLSLLFLYILAYAGGLPVTGTQNTPIRPADIVIIMLPYFLPVLIAAGGLCSWPVEKGISELYFRDAQRILKNHSGLIRIGITGSWGKTSVKFILGTILEEKFRTLVTPSSFNTPMGVTKVVRTSLEPGHQIFVAEMGARHVGDIKELCRLVHPQIGILTSVGPQHLDTFKTIERIRSTKYELVQGLPDDGFAVFNDDDSICRELYEITTRKKRLTGTCPDRDDVWAENIRSFNGGSWFDLCSHQFRVVCQTRLLGELNIRNIVLAAAVAMELGMNETEIARGISKIKPVEHRLQLIDNPAGITIIDDAFNSNIVGAEQAFKTLRDFPGKRIVITPGMVELGEQETALNVKFGSMMADCCDISILIGKKRSDAIRSGLLSKGFSADRIHVVDSLQDATGLLQTIVQKGDTVLFENDLPDNYQE